MENGFSSIIIKILLNFKKKWGRSRVLVAKMSQSKPIFLKLTTSELQFLAVMLLEK
jgi:hypothetical protein